MGFAAAPKRMLLLAKMKGNSISAAATQARSAPCIGSERHCLILAGFIWSFPERACVPNKDDPSDVEARRWSGCELLR